MGGWIFMSEGWESGNGVFDDGMVYDDYVE